MKREIVLDTETTGLNPLAGDGARDRTDPSYAALVP